MTRQDRVGETAAKESWSGAARPNKRTLEA
jgi:hypothetical protein